MSCAVTPCQSGGSSILSIPKAMAQALADRRSLVDRLTASPSRQLLVSTIAPRCTTVLWGVSCRETPSRVR